MTVRTGNERFVLKDGFEVVASAKTISLAPSTGQPGQKLTVAITGTNTQLMQGVSTARFGDGISVGGAPPGESGPVTVTSLTAGSAALAITPDALLGPRTVTVKTANEEVSLIDGFIVVAPPAITSVVPVRGQVRGRSSKL